MRFATVPRMATFPSASLAPIRTKVALACAFAALITPCTLATAAGARSAAPPVAQAVFVTPSGDRAAAQRAVTAAGGVSAGWVGGKLKAALDANALRRVVGSPAVASAAPAETSSADAIISQGVALSGADALQRAGSDGSGVTIVVLDQAFGAATRLNALAGSELPPLERQHRLSFDALYGLAGRDYNSNSSRHGEFVSEIVYDMAPGANYWFVNYHSPDEFGQAVDYITNVIKPQIVVHSNSFLFGPFDGSGWFAQKVDAAAAAGILWVNSAGNYRTRHWEGAWSDADGDGNLDVPGDGNAFRVDLIATSRPACDISWAGATSNPADYYTLALYQDAALTTPVIDKKTLQPIVSSGLSALPDPHASMGPGAISSPGPYYVAVRRVGNPPTTRLTLYCRMDLSPAAQVTASSSPTPGDAVGAFSVGAIDATTLLPESYSSEGPTDDGRNKPDITAPTNVLITPGDPEAEALTSCGGTSCATPHVGGAAALLWASVAADGGTGSVAQRVRDRLVAQALDMGPPGADTVFGAGRLRLDLAAPVLGTPSPANNALVRGTVSLALPVADAGTLGTAAAHGRRQAARGDAGARRHPARHLADRGARGGSACARPRRLRPERQQRDLPPHAARRQRGSAGAPARAPADARRRQGARLGLRARHGQRPGGAPAHRVRRRHPRERLPPRAPLQAQGALHAHDPHHRSRRQQHCWSAGRCACARPSRRRAGGRLAA